MIAFFALLSGIGDAAENTQDINYHGDEVIDPTVEIYPNVDVLDWDWTVMGDEIDTMDPELGWGYGPEDWSVAANGQPITIQVRDMYGNGYLAPGMTYPLQITGYDEYTDYIDLSGSYQTIWESPSVLGPTPVDFKYSQWRESGDPETGSITLQAYAF